MQSDEKYLEKACPGFLSITKAPSFCDLEWNAQNNKLDLDLLIKNESEKKYSACDQKGNIYLIQNPAIWEFVERFDDKVRYKYKTKIRRQPEEYKIVTEDKKQSSGRTF